jgi:hypothetical protein
VTYHDGSQVTFSFLAAGASVASGASGAASDLLGAGSFSPITTGTGFALQVNI